MTDVSERVAVLEADNKRTASDVSTLFSMFREHMEKEEQDREKFLSITGDINTKLNNQKSFWAGMLFAFTGVGAFIGTMISWIGRHGGS